MKSKRRGTNKTAILVIVVVIFLGIAGNYLLKQQAVSTNERIQTYQSRNLKFSIELTDDFTINDDGITLSLNKEGEEIEIVRNGTSYENIDDYIKYFDSKRDLIPVTSEKVSVGGHDAVIRLVKLPSQEITKMSYYIYVKDAVYIFSTSSESLFDELDQIAQSFRYIP